MLFSRFALFSQALRMQFHSNVPLVLDNFPYFAEVVSDVIHF